MLAIADFRAKATWQIWKDECAKFANSELLNFEHMYSLQISASFLKRKPCAFAVASGALSFPKSDFVGGNHHIIYVK